MVALTANRKSEAEALAAEAAHVYYVGRYANALDLYDRALSLDAGNVRAHTGRAFALAQLGNADDGAAAAQKAITLDARFANAYCALGICFHRLNREKEALAMFEKALKVAPEDAKVLYNIACYWAEKRDENNCRSFLARAFRNVSLDTIDHSRNDPDLARYVETEWFRELLANAKKARLERQREKPE